ncbi:MAG TPA: hypothetical protein VG842_04355 [Sediminibacterium sp.]|nr:hypothetical protein [Sediminibacterium sp.]
MKLQFLICLMVLLGSAKAKAQPGTHIRFSSSHAMFPDTARAKGHLYQGQLYDAASHYNDSSVWVYVPAYYRPSAHPELIYWFHGWSNNLDTANQKYRVTEQFFASRRNAVWIMVEGPKNAPDSYGGKLEQPAQFQALINEVLDTLATHHFLKKSTRHFSDCNITLGGHSGAYRVISRILNYTPVKEVLLFDALYGGNEAYLEWIKQPGHRFVNIFTHVGGTDQNSALVAKLLTDSLHVPVTNIKEEVLDQVKHIGGATVFIDSQQTHSGVLTYEDRLKRLLQLFPLLK